MSQLPSDLPQLPKLPFLAADVVLLFTAILVAATQDGPLVGWPLAVVAVCVILATILCAIPFLTDYSRSQDQALDERQRALEALAKSLSSSSEQVGIAVQGVSRLDEQIQRHLRHLEQVPQRLNERLGELEQRLAASRDEQVEELERELAALKSSEGDRLEVVLDRIQRTSAELARLEREIVQRAEQAQLQASASAASSARLGESVGEAMLKSAETLSVGVSAARAELSALLGDFQQRLGTQVEAGLEAARSRAESVEGRLGRELGALAERVEARMENAAQALESTVARLSQQVEALSSALERAESRAASAPAAAFAEPARPESPEPAPAPAVPAAAEPPAPLAAIVSDIPLQTEPASGEAVPVSVPEAPRPPEAPLAVKTRAPEAPGAVAERLPEAVKVRLPRKKPEPVPEGMVMDLFAENFSLEEHYREPLVTRSVSADGATRLIVTAYIGIGNKLYIRGDGPGLSWEKGRPLDFVSIGKWRWESLEAESSFHFRLYKNDQVECPSLGQQKVDAGQQAELIANF